METPELISAAQAGNIQAFNRLILEYQDAIHSLIYYICPGQDVEALTQAAVWRIYQRLSDYHGADFRLWLFKIVVNVCRRALYPYWFRINRDNHRGKAQPQLSGISSHSSRIKSESIETSEIQSCLSGLQPDLRVVVVLIDLEKLDYTQAAAVLGIPMDSVGKRLAKARWQLSNHLHALQKDCP